MQIAKHLPVGVECGNLYFVHDTGETLHGIGEHLSGLFDSSLSYGCLRTVYEDGHGHREDNHDERQDANAQTDGYRLIDISDDRIHTLFNLPVLLHR